MIHVIRAIAAGEEDIRWSDLKMLAIRARVRGWSSGRCGKRQEKSSNQNDTHDEDSSHPAHLGTVILAPRLGRIHVKRPGSTSWRRCDVLPHHLAVIAAIGRVHADPVCDGLRSQVARMDTGHDRVGA